MVASKKKSSASSSAKTRSKGTAATAKISKSTKENTTTTVTKATTPSSATKKTTPSNKLDQKPAAKPLQARTPLSQGVDDAEIAALLAKVTAQKAEIDKLKKSQASKPVEKISKEIKRPPKITNLQNDMGLADNKKLYSHCLATVRDVSAHAGLTAKGDWRGRDAVSIAKVAEVAKSRNKQLRHYEGNWATYEILKRFFKSKRHYKKQKRITSVDDDDGSDLDNKDVILKDDEESDNDGNGDDGGDSDGDGNGEGEESDNGDSDGDGNGEGEESDDGDGDGDGGKDDDNAVDSWNGKGKGKAKEGSGYATGSKRKMPQMVGKSKKMRL